jgi:hypothetical protein
VPRTLAQKLLLADGPVLVVGTARLDAPTADAVLELAGTAVVRTEDATTADVAVLFVEDRDDLDERIPGLLDGLGGARVVWIAYRKGNVVDINRDSIAATVPDHGWRAVTQIALDETWSALRLRPAE